MAKQERETKKKIEYEEEKNDYKQTNTQKENSPRERENE